MLAAVLACCFFADDKPTLQRIPGNEGDPPVAVVVADGAPLAHTTQLFGSEKDGGVEQQLAGLIDRLAKELESVKSNLDAIVKLNIHVAKATDVPVVEKSLAKRLGAKLPAVCISVGSSIEKGSLVSLDAVAVADVHLKTVERKGSVSVLPAGPVYYVAGQAEAGATLEAATTNTLASLRRTLAEYKRDDGDVVQIKAFVNPIAKVSEVRKAIEAFYGKDKVPPVVIVEWTMKDIEIEVIASAPITDAKAKDAIDYLTPTKMTASPVYSRVARINHGRRIYTSGLAGVGKDGEAQVKDFFEKLKEVLKKSASDLNHLVKATYLVSSDDSSKQLNALRPRFYDPKRPPSASKAGVVATGRKDCDLVVDMIAVCAK